MSRAITLKPGETFVLPKGATIEAIFQSGGGYAYSECYIPPASDRKCYKLQWEFHESTDAYVAIILGGIEYAITHASTAGDLIGIIDGHPTLSLLIKGFCSEEEEGGGELDPKYFNKVFILAPPSLAPIELKIEDVMKKSILSAGTTFPYYVRGIEDAGCEACNDFV